MIIVRYTTDSKFVKQMFHVQAELINNTYPKMGIKMYSENIENGGLLFFAGLSDFRKFFELYLEFNKKGYDFLIHSKDCSPQNLQGKMQASIQILAEFTSIEVSKENIIDQICAVYEKTAEYIASTCKWNEKCNCIKIERLNPTSLSIILRREQDLCEILPLIPFGKKMKPSPQPP